MPDIDVVSLSEVNAGSYEPGSIVVPVDGDHSPRFRRPRRQTATTERPRLEPLNGWIWKQCTGDASATEFAFDDSMPPNVHVVDTAIYVANTSMTATTTISIGKSGSTAAYHTASHFGSSMNAVGAKTVTNLRAHETATQTPVVTFSAAPESGAKILAGVCYIAAPAIV